jgi:anti-anti-sigma factor
VTIVFEGEYDLVAQRGVKEKLDPAIPEPDVVVDLTKVSYLDSACVAELLLFSHARRKRGLPPETIVVVPGTVARVLEVTGVTKVCRVVNPP